MFTGLVSSSGIVTARIARGPGARLAVQATFSDGPIQRGESIAVDGCCLTVAAVVPKGFESDASSETLARTTLGAARAGYVANLERALRATDRLGGHMVSGHIDGVSTLIARKPVGDAVVMSFTLPEGLARYVAEKGSIAVNGVSLTANVAHAGRFEVTIIPVTLASTNFNRMASGDRVNIEVDIVARYIGRLMMFAPSNSTLESE